LKRSHKEKAILLLVLNAQFITKTGKEHTMLVQNNSTPLVFLALLVMGGCVIAGMLLGGVGPFNNETAAQRIQITQTQAAINAYAAQQSLGSALTLQAPLAQQTLVAAQMTAVPAQQTATALGEMSELQGAVANATQSRILAESQNAQLMAQATQTAVASEAELRAVSQRATMTAIAREQVNESERRVTNYMALGLGLLLVSGWLLIRAATQVINARTRENEANTKLLAEQRRLASTRASIQNQKDRQRTQNRIPTSLMKKPSTNRGLPKGE
jgi:hypothetical protein